MSIVPTAIPRAPQFQTSVCCNEAASSAALLRHIRDVWRRLLANHCCRGAVEASRRHPQSEAGSPCRNNVQCPRTASTILQNAQQDVPPRTWKCAAREIAEKKNRTTLTRTRAPEARCRLRSHSPPPSHVPRPRKRGKPETTVAWEARRRGSMRGDRGGWMNVVGPPVHIQPVRPPSWTRLLDRASCLPG